MQQLKPITLKLSSHKIYKVASLIERITDTDTPFIDIRRTNETFQTMAEEIYKPLFEFIKLHRLEVNFIFTGDYIEKLEKYSPKTLRTLQTLVRQGLVTLVLDAYYGNSLSALYNMAWWARSVARTQASLEKTLGFKAEFVYLPQLFRQLELERVTGVLGTTKFLLQSKGKKIDFYQSKLSDLRRFDGQNPAWLEGDADAECEFYFVPDRFFMLPNRLHFERDRALAVQAFCMNAGLQYNRFFLRPRTSTAVEPAKSTNPRISEKFSLGLYSQLQRSVIRLWDYASFIIASEEYVENQEYTRIKTISRNFAALQDPFFLEYLQPKFYHVSHLELTNFASPYEAYVSMQACVKHLEILLKNKI